MDAGMPMPIEEKKEVKKIEKEGVCEAVREKGLKKIGKNGKPKRRKGVRVWYKALGITL